MKLSFLSAAMLAVVSSGAALYPAKRPANMKSPEGPSQQCRDDAGPPWMDQEGAPYYEGQPNRAVLNSTGLCPTPLEAACKRKGVLAAHLDGPVNCNGNGWHCRILPRKGWQNPDYVDLNMQLCNVPNADESDQGGHCHGSDQDDVYGWWVMDHWHRGYTGDLHCCCNPAPGWPEGLKGLVNRCDYRRHIAPEDLGKCRDANEDHPGPPFSKVSFEEGCESFKKSHPYKDPVKETPDQCWVVEYFSTWDNAPKVPSPPPTAVATAKPTSNPTNPVTGSPTSNPTNPVTGSPTSNPTNPKVTGNPTEGSTGRPTGVDKTKTPTNDEGIDATERPTRDAGGNAAPELAPSILAVTGLVMSLIALQSHQI